MTWDEAFTRSLNVPGEIAAVTARQQLAGKPWLLLLNMEVPFAERDNFRLVYKNQRPVYARTSEQYWLYEPVMRMQPKPP
jgi:hypothetical protein